MKQRLWYLDILRIVSILLVMFNHTGTAGYSLFTIAGNSPFYFFYLAFSCFDKVAVPIFFMISGALLLGKQESVSKVFRHRVLRMLIALVLASFVLYFGLAYRDGTLADCSFAGFLQGLYSGTIIVPLWFMYAYLMYLLTLPLLRKIAQGIQQQEWLLLFCVYAFVNLLPILDFMLFGANGITHDGYLRSFAAENVVFFPLLGYYLSCVVDDSKLSARAFAILAASAVACVIANAALVYAWYVDVGTWSGNTFEHFISAFVAVPAAALFCGMRLLFERHEINKRAVKVLGILGGATFGLYLFEPIFRSTTKGVFQILVPYLHSFLACWVWVLVAYAFGTIFILLLKKLPGMKAIL